MAVQGGPNSSCASSWTRRLFVALGVVAVIAVRKHDSLTNPQFWAEDGGLFFIDQERFRTWLLFAPYQGYLHLLPRLIAALGRYVPLAAVPAFYAWFALIVTGAVAWGLQSQRVPLAGTTAAALAIALIPNTGEVYLTVCNLQWVLALGLFALAICNDPETLLQRSLEILALLILGLTGPFIAPALPIFCWRALHNRSAWSLMLLALAAACLCIQAPDMLSYHPNPVGQAWVPMHCAAVIGRRLVAVLLFGRSNPGESVCIGMLILVPSAIIWRLWTRRESLPGGILLAVAGILTLGASIYKTRLDTWPFDDLVSGDRYFFTLRILLVWLAAAVAGTLGRSAPRVLGGVALAAFAINLSHFVFAPYPDYHWRLFCQRIERGERVRVPILPDGFTFTWQGGRPPFR